MFKATFIDCAAARAPTTQARRPPSRKQRFSRENKQPWPAIGTRLIDSARKHPCRLPTPTRAKTNGVVDAANAIPGFEKSAGAGPTRMRSPAPEAAPSPLAAQEEGSAPNVVSLSRCARLFFPSGKTSETPPPPHLALTPPLALLLLRYPSPIPLRSFCWDKESRQEQKEKTVETKGTQSKPKPSSSLRRRQNIKSQKPIEETGREKEDRIKRGGGRTGDFETNERR